MIVFNESNYSIAELHCISFILSLLVWSFYPLWFLRRSRNRSTQHSSVLKCLLLMHINIYLTLCWKVNPAHFQWVNARTLMYKSLSVWCRQELKYKHTTGPGVTGYLPLFQVHTSLNINSARCINAKQHILVLVSKQDMKVMKIRQYINNKSRQS